MTREHLWVRKRIHGNSQAIQRATTREGVESQKSKSRQAQRDDATQLQRMLLP